MKKFFIILRNRLHEKKKWLILFFVLYLLAGPGGCVRLEREYGNHTTLIVIDGGATRHWSPQPVPERFFGGTKENVRRICHGNLNLKTPCYLLDIPFELIADILFLPKDVFLYAGYIINPPLALLVHQNKYDELKARLENGEYPNAADLRYPGPWPVEQAIYDDNAAMYALLLEYGAPSMRPYDIVDHYTPNAKEMIRLALERDGSQAVKNNDGDPVFTWCRILKDGKNMTQEAQENCVCIIEMLLEHGFSAQFPHEYWEQNKGIQMTPLDLIISSQSLSPKLKERVVSLLRAHGGMILEEVTSKNRTVPSNPVIIKNPEPCDFSSQLKKDGIEIDPIFNQAVKILMGDPTSRYYRISTKFPGLECPALVIDFGIPDKNGNLFYRKNIKIHRRVSKTEWNQQTKEFEIPVQGRLIFTPKGLRIPSRLQEDMPQCILREAWLTFADCECYCESLGAKWSSHPEENTLAFTRIAEGQAEKTDKKGYLDYVWSNDRPIHTELSVYQDTITQADKTCLEKASLATAEAGIAGDWSRTINTNDERIYHFTNHGRFKKTISEEIVPYPDEILCSLHIYRPAKHNKSKGTPVITLNSLEGKSYWNCRSAAYKEMHLRIFFGDEVPLEKVEQLHQALDKALR